MGATPLDRSNWLPLVWAQVGVSGPGGAGSSPSTGSLLQLSLQRWLGSVTLSPTTIRGGEIAEGVWAFLASALALLVLVAVIQGPGRALGQIADLKGHRELLDQATRRVRRAGRLLVGMVAAVVLSWTTMQGFRYAQASGRDDLALLMTNRRVVDVAWAQGALAALTPTRDVIGLGGMIPMLGIAAFVLFQFSTFRWSAIRPDPAIRERVTRWATIGWAATGLYAIYRFVSLVATGFGDRPVGGCLLGAEAFVVPVLMILAEGVVAAWVLVELRQGHGNEDRLDLTSIVLLVPEAVTVCLLTFPARYLAAGLVLGVGYLPSALLSNRRFGSALSWELGPGLIAWQAAGLVLTPVLAVAAWSGRTRSGLARGWFRLLRQEGGRVAVVVLAGGLAAGLGSALAYAALLALPNSSWGLLAADSYAHYATLPVGLVTLAALVELAGRSAPELPKPEPDAEDWGA